MSKKKFEGVRLDAPPIVQQPRLNPANRDPWMSIPSGIRSEDNCPLGLECLTTLDMLIVHQKVNLLEVITGLEQQNQYEIKNELGQRVYYAVEESSWSERRHCGAQRSFHMRIYNFQNEVIHLYRPFRCGCCCGCCCQDCLQIIEVYSPPGTFIGTVNEECNRSPSYSIKNGAGDTILRVKGPACQCDCSPDIDFNVTSTHNEEIGKISRQWSGFTRALFTDADNFGVSFPLDLDVRTKVLLLGATFLIDMNYFEN